MTIFTCPQCGAAMALAETQCASCGAKAPEGRAALAFAQKAEEAYQAGRLAQAAQHLRKALEENLPEPQRPLAWRKLGIWQQRLGQAESAAECFRQAMEFEDEIAHHLWIDSLSQMGRLAEAREYYQRRLGANTSDAVAAQQLKIVELSADFKSRSLGRVPPRAPSSRLERALSPKPWKWILAGNLLVCFLSLAALAWWRQRRQVKGDLSFGAGGEAAADLMLPLLSDPWAWLLPGLFCGAVLVLMLRWRS